jgi:radical SAM-linked protein
LDAPLPWDHIDTGITKQWLKADLERALEAAIVPDCSFDGCSHCGVCGADFGHNIVIKPPATPAFDGHFVPNQARVQRWRVWFGKHQDMALVSHLDLLRLFDRAIRRAALPISFTNGFHPSPRISPANALSLGATSAGEIVDFELTESIAQSEFYQRLTAQLPLTIPLYRIESIPLTAPSATHALEQAEYLIFLNTLDEAGNFIPDEEWQRWIREIMAIEHIQVEQVSKSGKVRLVNLRDRLVTLEWVGAGSLLLSQLGAVRDTSPIALRYRGSCRNDGTLLRPEHVVHMLEHVAHRSVQLLHVHRHRLILADEAGVT